MRFFWASDMQIGQREASSRWPVTSSSDSIRRVCFVTPSFLNGRPKRQPNQTEAGSSIVVLLTRTSGFRLLAYTTSLLVARLLHGFLGLQRDDWSNRQKTLRKNTDETHSETEIYAVLAIVRWAMGHRTIWSIVQMKHELYVPLHG